jgi:hypothetical protein
MSEHSEQVALFEWATWQINLGVEALQWMYAIPNGGLRNKTTGAKLKAEGVKAGIPDICLPCPAQGYHGLYIEMKADGGKPTPSQVEYLMKLNEYGYLGQIANGFDGAKEIICKYLEIIDG